MNTKKTKPISLSKLTHAIQSLIKEVHRIGNNQLDTMSELDQIKKALVILIKAQHDAKLLSEKLIKSLFK